jgi:hypothetical protein
MLELFKKPNVNYLKLTIEQREKCSFASGMVPLFSISYRHFYRYHNRLVRQSRISPLTLIYETETHLGLSLFMFICQTFDEIYSFDRALGIIFPEGARWREQRRFATRTLRQARASQLSQPALRLHFGRIRIHRLITTLDPNPAFEAQIAT